jgi:hypothetical protein
VHHRVSKTVENQPPVFVTCGAKAKGFDGGSAHPEQPEQLIHAVRERADALADVANPQLGFSREFSPLRHWTWSRRVLSHRQGTGGGNETGKGRSLGFWRGGLVATRRPGVGFYSWGQGAGGSHDEQAFRRGLSPPPFISC